MIEPGHMELSTDEPVLFARPSIDVLLETAAESYRERCIGVVLTGANADGARGLARVAELGGTAIVQDPATAQREEMPRAALQATPKAKVLPAAEIAPLLVSLCGLARVSV
jgi:two-component system chemotaxis response regulator CheB